MRRLLIANRGEIARRIIRTAREMGIATVAVYSDVDADAPFVREADLAVRLGGATPAESYLRGDAIIDAARRTQADAIHPGYGFLAENAGFARACADAGITFVGPTPEAIDAMGSKLAAKRQLEQAGVPVLPEGTEEFPLIIKPSAGGGGKGMRVVRRPEDLDAAIEASRREAASSFGDDTLLFERFVETGRHVEIQILGDTHGNVVSLGERECSIQRRHQKVLEESPSVAVDAALRKRMGDAAVAAGKAIGYVGAGTVEFLLGDDGEFYFLEVNTRLQVEHPVTEEVLLLDLVRCQLEIADGGRVPDVPEPFGHAIEVRLYAEDPAADFLPQTGTLSWLDLGDEVRVDTGVESGSEISIHYDPMIAKVIAHAETRAEAARVLAAALRRAEIDGLRTNRDFLVRLLEDAAFLAGDFDTHYLDRPESSALLQPLVEDVTLHAQAAAIASAAARRATATVQATIPAGWRNNPIGLPTVEYAHGDDTLLVAYPAPDLTVLHADAERVDLEADGVRRTFGVRRHGDRVSVSGPDGQVDLVELPRHPDPADQVAAGSLLAPMPGKVIRVDAAVGDVVTAGRPLLVLEAMKMEHEIVAPTDGTVSALPLKVGDQVDAGALLAAIDEPADD